MDEERCESASYDDEEEIAHDCFEVKGHEGPHICVACSEQW